MSLGEQFVALLFDLFGTFVTTLMTAVFGAIIVPFFEALFNLIFGGAAA
jgi:hypothetical protein